LGFVGLTEIRSIVIEPTLAGGPVLAAERVQRAVAKARELAESF
jgi:FMN-dependent NADH-azoreductase